MKAFALAVLLAALAAIAHGTSSIDECRMFGDCPTFCQLQYGPQADGTCQENEDHQRCICLHTNQEVQRGECDVAGGCRIRCMGQYGYQSDGFCQKSEDKERCICIHVGVLPMTGPLGSKGRQVSKGQPKHPQHKHI